MNPAAYLEMANTEAAHWWFCGRRAILCRLIKRLKLPVDAQILEIGCGTGGNLQMLRGFGTVSAMELDATARAIATQDLSRRCEIHAGSCPGDIPFAGRKFDLVCMFDVLEHIEEDIATLAAVKELLAPDGRFFVTVPAYQWLWGAHDVFLHHKRRYKSSELASKARQVGLAPIRISYFNTLLFPLAALVRFKEKLIGDPVASGTGIPVAPVNTFFKWLFSSERHLLEHANLPLGVSLLGIFIARKD